VKPHGVRTKHMLSMQQACGTRGSKSACSLKVVTRYVHEEFAAVCQVEW
jgi:hypothetical protein